MSEPAQPNSFYDIPTNELSDEQKDALLDMPFLLVKIVGFEDEYTPNFQIIYGSGMPKEDVPTLVEMLYELFLPELQARAQADAEGDA